MHSFTFNLSIQKGFKALFGLLIASLFIIPGPLSGAQQRNNRYEDDSANVIREMRDTIDSMRHEVSNHETELRAFEERADNQDATISSLRQQLLDSNQANKELVKGNVVGQESKISSLEAANKGFLADLNQLKTHANESATVLTQYKQKIAELEKIITLQNQNIDNLQSALSSIMEAVAGSSKSSAIAVSSPSGKTYKVKNGDSLEKIAKANGTTIKAIKALNDLSNDKIRVGQTLQMPE